MRRVVEVGVSRLNHYSYSNCHICERARLEKSGRRDEKSGPRAFHCKKDESVTAICWFESFGAQKHQLYWTDGGVGGASPLTTTHESSGTSSSRR